MLDSLSCLPVMFDTQDELAEIIMEAQAEDKYINVIKKLIKNKEINDYQLRNTLQEWESQKYLVVLFCNIREIKLSVIVRANIVTGMYYILRKNKNAYESISYFVKKLTDL